MKMFLFISYIYVLWHKYIIYLCSSWSAIGGALSSRTSFTERDSSQVLTALSGCVQGVGA